MREYRTLSIWKDGIAIVKQVYDWQSSFLLNQLNKEQEMINNLIYKLKANS